MTIHLSFFRLRSQGAKSQHAVNRGHSRGARRGWRHGTRPLRIATVRVCCPPKNEREVRVSASSLSPSRIVLKQASISSAIHLHAWSPAGI